MPMDINQAQYGDIMVLEPGGSLNTLPAQDLEIKVVNLLDGGSELFVVDFHKVDHLASSGIRVLVMLAKRLMGTNGQLVLCSLNEQVKTVLDIAGLAQYFEIVESREDAVNCLYPLSKPGQLSMRVLAVLNKNENEVSRVNSAAQDNEVTKLAARVSDLLSGEGMEVLDVSAGQGSSPSPSNAHGAFSCLAHGVINRSWKKLKDAVFKPKPDC